MKKITKLSSPKEEDESFLFPQGVIHDEVRKKILRSALAELKEVREEFKIPKSGFTWLGDMDSFEINLREESRKILTREVKRLKKMTKKEGLEFLQKKIPRYIFEKKISQLMELAGIPQRLFDHVVAFVLCDEFPCLLFCDSGNPLSRMFKPSHKFYKNNYHVVTSSAFGRDVDVRETGLTVKLYSKLKQDEWKQLKKEVDRWFDEFFPGEKSQRKRRDIEIDLEILRNGDQDIWYDDKKMNEKTCGSLKKRKQRILKNRDKK